tara:strand:+ start:430 stop:804 length:375 start_codon:yes stop_codon:yes gene_type:complete
MSLKDKIMNGIKSSYNEEVYILDLIKLIPEIKGNMIFLKGLNNYKAQTAIIGGVSSEAVDALNVIMFKEKLVDITPLAEIDLLFDGLGIWNQYPIFKPSYLDDKKVLNSKKIYWTPVKLKYINK